jgi:uncharacterized membrane protein (UPF0136 family)
MNPPATPWAAAAVGAAVYGLIALAGGVMGYVNKGSKPSLIAGGGSGLSLILCGIGIWLGHTWAVVVALIIALLLVGRFASSLAKQSRIGIGIFGTVIGKVGLIMVMGGLIEMILAVWALMR